ATYSRPSATYSRPSATYSRRSVRYFRRSVTRSPPSVDCLPAFGGAAESQHARSVAGRPHIDLFADTPLEFADMADDADESPSGAQRAELVHNRIQALGIQGAKSLIDEEGAQAYSAARAGDHIGQSQCQAQRGVKSFAAGQCARLTLTPGDVIEYPKSQTGAPAAAGLDFFAADQAQPAGRHFREPRVSRLDNVFEAPQQHIGTQGNFLNIGLGAAFGDTGETNGRSGIGNDVS